MGVIRAFVLLIGFASICVGATPTAVVVIKQHQPREKHSCSLVIAAVDGRDLKPPQQQVTLTPGRHVLIIRVHFLLASLPVVDAPLEDTFKAHHYTIDGQLTRPGALKLRRMDDTEQQRSGSKLPPPLK